MDDLINEALDAIQDLVDGDGTWEEKWQRMRALAEAHGQTSILDEFLSWFDEEAEKDPLWGDDDDDDPWGE